MILLCPPVIKYLITTWLHKSECRSRPTWHYKSNVTFNSKQPQSTQQDLRTNIWKIKIHKTYVLTGHKMHSGTGFVFLNCFLNIFHKGRSAARLWYTFGVLLKVYPHTQAAWIWSSETISRQCCCHCASCFSCLCLSLSQICLCLPAQ